MGVRADVLLDSLGEAKGIDIDYNGTTIYFTIDGCIGRVDYDGQDLKEVLCYDEEEDDEETDMQGLALYQYDDKMYWVDNARGKLYGANLEGKKYWVVLDNFTSPHDVAVDETSAKLYVADKKGIYSLDQDGSDFTVELAADESGLDNFMGLDVDATNRELYFTASSGVYSADIFDISGDYSALYGDLENPVGVAVDNTQGYIFFIDDTGVYIGDTSGEKDKEMVAEVEQARYVAVLAEAAPTPSPTATPTATPSKSPTPLPTRSPSGAPSAAPSGAPAPAPTASPTPLPTLIPSPQPSSVPSYTPTAGPSKAPTAGPSTAPSQSPSATPSAAPSAAPSRAPSEAPSGSPTSTPTDTCYYEMNKCGMCDGAAGYECSASD